MNSFEKGWGWFYWTWDTEDAPQWSWKKGRLAGILPTDLTVSRNIDAICGGPGKVPSTFDGLPENY